MNENRISFFIIFGILGFVALMFWAFQNTTVKSILQDNTYKVIQKWKMPSKLDEISGISWISEDKIACVQDEKGIIFIYNLKKKQVENQINFAKTGDFEGLTIIDSTAYVMESSGKIFEVSNYNSPNFKTTTYQTPFSEKNNMESLVADTINKRLLFTIKDKDPNSDSYKGIYAFNLQTKKTEKDPIFKIPLSDTIFGIDANTKNAGKENNFYPSEIGINPKNGNIYILEGKNPKLIILNNLGKPIKLHNLNRKEFPQAEGLTFSDEGTIFISNEGKNGNATILKVVFDE